MTRDELIEKVARIIQRGHVARDITVNSHDTARKIAGLFFEALKEPSKEMVKASWNDAKSYHNTHIWQAMLAASPLAPEGGRE